MTDQSQLDNKYFLDKHVYNCPHCNRRHVKYTLMDNNIFDWSSNKQCYCYFIQCNSCGKNSMHLSFESLHDRDGLNRVYIKDIEDIDSKIFYSVPTSFFVLDERIPNVLRELITEAEGCLKMNFLTGASACMRKSIYELLIIEKCSGANYDDKIKELKSKYKDTDPALFDILAHIKDMTSDKVHEQSWDKWNSGTLRLVIETLKAVLYDIYVVPAIRTERAKTVLQLQEKIKLGKK